MYLVDLLTQRWPRPNIINIINVDSEGLVPEFRTTTPQPCRSLLFTIPAFLSYKSLWSSLMPPPGPPPGSYSPQMSGLG